MSEDNQKILIDNQPMTLADLAGVTLDDVAEKRGESLPKGFFMFEVESGEDAPHLVVVGEGDKAKACAKFKLKVIDVISVTDNEYTGNKDDLIGKHHFENLFVTNADGLGYLKAFMKDIGMANSGKPLKELLADGTGVRFEAPIGKKKNPNDTDQVFTNIVRGSKIKPVAAAPVSTIAAVV